MREAAACSACIVAKLRIPMRGYEIFRDSPSTGNRWLRIPMRGYETRRG